MNTKKINNDLIPPEDMMMSSIGGIRGFKKAGEDFLKIFIEHGNLQPNSKVLDIGCGVGRIALALTSYLSEQGEYYGFDIDQKRVDWCESKYNSKYPNFHFEFSDVYNKDYNPTGTFKASNYQFSYANSSFDFVCLTSIFTHMLIEEIDNYISEISRVLKSDGKCLITYFLLNSESLTNLIVLNNQIKPRFRFKIKGGLTANRDLPEKAVAYHEQVIRSIYEKHGLNIEEAILYGSWCMRKNFLKRQDIIIATKF